MTDLNITSKSIKSIFISLYYLFNLGFLYLFLSLIHNVFILTDANSLNDYLEPFIIWIIVNVIFILSAITYAIVNYYKII